jgi:hypothetical protein
MMKSTDYSDRFVRSIRNDERPTQGIFAAPVMIFSCVMNLTDAFW